MSTPAAQLLQRHLETFVDAPVRWRELIADDMVWELPYAPALGHPTRLDGRDQVLAHVGWFLAAVEGFRFSDIRIQAMADGNAAVAEVKAEGLIKATGRTYRQEYVLFLRARGDRIASIREYFDPTRAAAALDAPILGLND